MISGIKGHSDVSVTHAVGLSSISPRMEKAEHKIDDDTMHIEKQGMIYRRGTSVAVKDLERELSFLLPNDDYHDAGGEARQLKKKRTNKGSNSGLKSVNRIDIEKVNREQPPTN